MICCTVGGPLSEQGPSTRQNPSPPQEGAWLQEGIPNLMSIHSSLSSIISQSPSIQEGSGRQAQDHVPKREISPFSPLSCSYTSKKMERWAGWRQHLRLEAITASKNNYSLKWREYLDPRRELQGPDILNLHISQSHGGINRRKKKMKNNHSSGY